MRSRGRLRPRFGVCLMPPGEGPESDPPGVGVMGNALKEPLSDHRAKPDGGYVHVSTFRFGIAWWAYQQGELSIRAVRVLLALHELLMRRTAYLWTEKKQGRKPDPEFTPHFSTEELASFCGLPEKRARA